MTEAKKPAKKAAAKKAAEPRPSEQTQAEVEKVAHAVLPEKAPEYALPEFALPQGHYFHPPVTSARAHDGSDALSNGPLRLLQRFMEVPETGRYDDATVERVVGWKELHGLGSSPVIDEETWQAIRSDG